MNYKYFNEPKDNQAHCMDCWCLDVERISHSYWVLEDGWETQHEHYRCDHCDSNNVHLPRE